MYVFLSQEWIDAARQIRERHPVGEVSASVRINHVITEVPFGDGTIVAYIDTSDGALRLELGQLDEPDAVMMTDYETARALFVGRDPAVVMQAFLAGRLTVQGDMMKLLALQAAAPEVPEALADEIAAITLD